MWRDEVKEFITSQVGKIWYVWGGQNIGGGVADCSGLVLEVLKKFGRLPKDFPDTTADGLYKFVTTPTENPKPGDLVFYGRSRISHVMFYVGKVYDIGDRCVAGMCGGRKNMTSNQARLMGSSLWVRKYPKYRNDFVGFGKVKERYARR